MKRSTRITIPVALVVVLCVSVGPARAAKPKESDLIATISSDAPPKDKAVPCKMLAIYGTEKAVPALAKLLPDRELASWARIALEAIPGPAADAALRDAVAKLKGRLQIGAINSLGVRRDAQAVGLLKARLADADVEVARAAAEALGRIGGDQAVSALLAALPPAKGEVRSSIALGCVYCAERLLNEGKGDRAAKVYDTIRTASDLPKHRIVEATRGAILSRGSAGVGLLVEQLRSADREMYGIGLRTARELPGPAATDALIAELKTAVDTRKAALLLALADRGAEKAVPVVLESAKAGPVDVRLVAIDVLAQLGDVSCLPVLLGAACEDDDKLTKAARRALAMLPEKADAEILARLAKAKGTEKQVLIEVAGRKQLAAAVPVVMSSVTDPDAGVRDTAVAVLAGLGGSEQIGEIIKALKATSDAKARGSLEKALVAISARVGAAATAQLMPLAKSGDTALRVIGTHALAGAGGPEALAAVVAATKDADKALADEAVRTLSTWPNRWPDDAGAVPPLLELVKSGKTLTHKVLAARGYLQYLRSTRKLNDAQKLAKLNDLMPLLARAEEKRDAVSALRGIRSAASLKVLTTLADDPAVADEACAAIIDLIAGRRPIRGLSKPQRRTALQLAVEKSKKPSTKRRAEDALKRIK